MAKAFDISIIGSGNVAWHLAQELERRGHNIREVYSRTPENAQALADTLYCAEVNPNLDFSKSDARLFILAVSDSAIQSVASQLMLPADAILVHTSGSQPLSVLANAAAKTGVFYPLQTFSKGRKVNFREIPICIESEDRKTESRLLKLAESLTEHIALVDSEARKVMHVAAVFACNFTNHMLHVASDILKEEEMDFELFKPLIRETLTKSLTLGPENAQTGPAVRGDLNTLDRHMEYLSGKGDLQRIYKLVSEHIMDYAQKEQDKPEDEW